MPTTEWLNKYESIKGKLTCKANLESHFTENLGMQTEQSCCGAFTVAVGILG